MIDSNRLIDQMALDYVNGARAQHEMAPLHSVLDADDTELLWGLRRAVKEIIKETRA